VINAGSSLGQFLFAPLNQLLTARSAGSPQCTPCDRGAATIPLTRLADRQVNGTPWPDRAAIARPGADAQEPAPDRRARSKLLVPARCFFTCGFHVAFLVTHLPAK